MIAPGELERSEKKRMAQSLDLWSMKCFIALADELHFGRAAKRLNMTQPTLSQQIKKLESTVGVLLFARSTRSVALSASGETFLPLAREALLKLDEAIVLSKLAGGGLSEGGELLKIGAIEPTTYDILPRILRRFRRRFPKTRLEVAMLDSIDLLRSLERGDCHVGLMRPPSNVNSLKFKELRTDRFVAVIPAQSPLAHRPTLRLSDFVGHDVFTLKRFELVSFRMVHDKLIEAGISLELPVQASNTTAALALSKAGLGITFLPEWVQDLANNDVVLRRVEDLTEEIPIGMGWRADNPIPGVLPFVEYAELVVRAS